MAQANVLCLLVLCCAVFAQVGLGAEVEVDAQGGAATHEAEDGLSVLLEQLSDQLDEKDRQLAELADMLIKAQNDASVVSEHYEKRISSVQQELAHALAALDEQVEMSRQTEERYVGRGWSGVWLCLCFFVFVCCFVCTCVYV